MGVRGLWTHCLENRAKCVEEVNLVDIARDRGGIEILVDFYCFEHYLIGKLNTTLNKVFRNPLLLVQGGEYKMIDEFIRKLFLDLKAVGITLVTVKDGAKGSSKETTEQKMDTWKSRYRSNMKDLRKVADVLSGEQDISTLKRGSRSRPVLIEVQILSSLRCCGAEVIECHAGEADYVLAKNLNDRPKAFAILSSDTDFCVFKGCAFFPTSMFDLRNDLYLGKNQLPPRAPKHRLMVGVVKSHRVVQSLGLVNHSALVELSIVAGNDFTGPVLYRLQGTFGLCSNRVEDVATWVKTYGRVENHPVLMEEMTGQSELAQRVAHSRRFYSLDPNIDNEGLAKPYLTRLIEDRVRQGHYPSAIYAMHLRFYWHRLIIEDLSVGKPIAEVALRDLRRHFYNMILSDGDQSVVEHGRDEDQHLVGVEIEMSEMRGLPKVTAINPDNSAQNLETFVRIITHFEPQFRLRYGTNDLKTTFVLYLLRYFANITVGQNLHVSEAEFDALFVTTLCSVDVSHYQEMAVKPNIRSVTVGNWFQALYRQVYKLLAALLHLQPLFPQPCEVFSGAVWTAFYMTNTEPDRLLTQGFPATVFQRITRDKDMVIRNHMRALAVVKQGFFM